MNPTQLLTYLLQPNIARLAADIISVYIQAATKVFGQWSSQMAEQWGDVMLAEVKAMVDMVIERVTPFSTNPHIEVQERVSHILSLSCQCANVSLGGEYSAAVCFHTERY